MKTASRQGCRDRRLWHRMWPPYHDLGRWRDLPDPVPNHKSPPHIGSWPGQFYKQKHISFLKSQIHARFRYQHKSLGNHPSFRLEKQFLKNQTTANHTPYTPNTPTEDRLLEAVGAHLQTTWLFEPAERPDESRLLPGLQFPLLVQAPLVLTLEWNGARPGPAKFRIFETARICTFFIYDENCVNWALKLLWVPFC